MEGAYLAVNYLGFRSDRIGQHSRALYPVNLFLVRMAAVQQMVFREPDGRRKSLIFSLISFVCLLGWVYFGIVLNGPHDLLFLGIAFAFSGLAESLPSTR